MLTLIVYLLLIAFLALALSSPGILASVTFGYIASLTVNADKAGIVGGALALVSIWATLIASSYLWFGPDTYSIILGCVLALVWSVPVSLGTFLLARRRPEASRPIPHSN